MEIRNEQMDYLMSIYRKNHGKFSSQLMVGMLYCDGYVVDFCQLDVNA